MGIRIRAVVLEDYKCFRGRHELAISDGIYGIMGRRDGADTQSNGAGKSSFVEAVLFCAYGYSAVAVDQLATEGTNGCRVAIGLSTDAGDVIIERGTGRHAGMTVKANGQTYTGVRVCEPLVRHYLGMGLDTFLATTFFAQGRADMLVNATPGKRKEYLYELLGLQVFDRAAEIAGKKVRDLEAQVLALQAQHETLTGVLTGLPEVDMEKVKKELKAAEVALADANKVLEGLKPDPELAATSALVDGLTREHLTAKQARVEVERVAKQAQETLRRDTTDLTAAEKGVERMEVAQKELDELQAQDEKLTGEMAALTTKMDVATASVDELREAISMLEASEAAECPTCRRAMTEDEKAGVLQKMREDMAQAVGAVNADAVRMSGMLKRETAIHDKMEPLEKVMDAGFVTVVKTLSPRIVRDEQAVTIANQKVVEAQGNVKALHSRLEQAADKLALLTARERTKAEKARLADRERDAAQERAQQARSAMALAKDSEERRGKLVEGMEAIKTQHNYALDALTLAEAVQGVVSKEGVPALLLANALTMVETSANEMLGKLMPGCELLINTQKQTQKGETAETLEFIVRRGDTERPFAAFSGGERMLLNFCLRMALADAAGRQTGFAVFDEIFGPLDESNRAAVAQALRVMSDRYPQAFVISHTDVREMFPKTITVVKTGEGSRLELTGDGGGNNGQTKVARGTMPTGRGTSSLPKVKSKGVPGRGAGIRSSTVAGKKIKVAAGRKGSR